jgi:hypothetical protein
MISKRAFGRKAAILSGAVLAGALGHANSAKATLTINLQFTNGTTTQTFATAPTGSASNISIRVYATITTATPVSTPAGGGTSTQTAPLGASHDGIQYAYYSVLSSLPTGTALGGALQAQTAVGGTTGGALTNVATQGVAFNANGAQAGLLQDINGDTVLDVGDKSQTAGGNATNWAKPRASGAIWDDAHNDTGTTQTGSGNEVFQYASSPNIVISNGGLTVSFLLETLKYHVSSVAAGQAVEFNPVVPTANDLGSLVPANWWENNATENPQTGTVTPNSSGANGTATNYLAGTSVVLLGPSGGPTTTASTHKIISLTNSNTPGTVYGVLLTNSATPTAGSNTATFNPNSPSANKINVTGSNGSYTPGKANNINGADSNSTAGAATDTVEATGFNPATDPEVYALKLLVGTAAPTSGQITTIIGEINASNTGLGVVASANTGALASVFPGYQILLTATGAGATGDEYLAWDFSQESSVGNVSVADVAAIPEPATAALMLISSAGLLLGRRRNQTA